MFLQAGDNIEVDICIGTGGHWGVGNHDLWWKFDYHRSGHSNTVVMRMKMRAAMRANPWD